jgi:dienelactone hydrolase
MIAPLRSVIAILLSLMVVQTAAEESVPLPSTALLDWEGDLAERMMEGLHRHAERRIVESLGKRGRHWERDGTSEGHYRKSIEPNRERLKKIIGLVDPRVPVTMERYGDDDDPALVAETDDYRVFQVRWPVLDGVTGEGLLLEPVGPAKALVVALPDADQTPEQLVGLATGVAAESQFARRLAENGFRVVVPTLIDRSDEWSGNAAVAFTNQPHREWIYRQAYHMGRHPLGYEVQKVLALVDWHRARQSADSKVGVAGYGEGGLVALLAAAVDTRIDACLVSGCFEPHTRPWEEPLYRNLWGFFCEFGDAEVASLIDFRGVIVEHSPFPAVDGPPPVREGRRAAGALGKLVTPPWVNVKAEYDRLVKLMPVPLLQSRQLVSGPDGAPTGPGSQEALEHLAQMLGAGAMGMPLSDKLPSDCRRSFSPRERQRRQVKELEEHVQRLVRGADRVRDEFWLSQGVTEPRTTESFTAEAPKLREYLWDEVLGRIDEPLLPPNARSRQIYDMPKWTGYDVVLDVFPDVFAWGVLLLPKDQEPGERRPVVVCQHGRQGIPRDVIEGDQAAYHDFAARLADRGFIVFAPHNPYRGEDRYRFLNRKANAVKASLFSYILAQHEQILGFLASLPQVDPERIAFYGLSYGGETAVRVPPLLPGYCLSICSADFNDWARKVASTDARYSFMFTIEWEMPYFDMGSTFNYAEMASLMVPRPFMVERGHGDGVAPDEWVAYEYAKVRRLYDALELGDRTEIEFFNGGHTINGQGTFRFLHRHLSWPEGE